MQLAFRNSSRAFAGLALLATLLNACGGGGFVEQPVDIVVSPTNLSLVVGGEAKPLTVTLSGVKPGETVRWESSASAVATVQGTGLNVSVVGVAPGSATIYAILASNDAKRTAVSVNVVSPPRSMTALAVTPTQQALFVGDQGTYFTPVPTKEATANVTYLWSSGNTSVVTVAASGGQVTAVGPGNTSVSVRAIAQGVGYRTDTLNASAVVTVTQRPSALASFEVSPPQATLSVNQTLGIVPNAQGAGPGVNVVYSFKSSDLTVATVGTSQGIVTAVAPGNATITVTATATGQGFTTDSAKKLVTITVSAARAGLDSIAVVPATAPGLVVGLTQQLAVTPWGPAATTTTLSTSYQAVTPAIVSVTQAGLITGVAPGVGSVKVTTTSPATSTLTASTVTYTVPVTVVSAPNACTGLTLSSGAVSVAQGLTTTLIPTITRGATATNTSNWTTNASTIATVSQAGVVSGVAPGSAVITLTINCSGAGLTSNSLNVTANVTVTGNGTFAPITNWQFTRLTTLLPASNLRQGWAASSSTWFVVGSDNVASAGGGVWRTTNSGSSWTRLPLSNSEQIVSIAGTSASNVYVLNATGAVWRFDGSTFTQVRSNGGFQYGAQAIALAGTTVLVLGDNDLPRIDRSVGGGAFTSMTLPTTAYLTSVAGVSATEAYAVGDSGLVLRYDGTSWTRAFQHPSKAVFNKVVAPSAGVAFASGTNDATSAAFMARLSGGTWASMTPPPTGFSDDLAVGASISELYSFDWPNKVHRFDGTNWSLVSPSAHPWQDARTIFTIGSGSVVSVGDYYASVSVLTGGAWSTVSATPDLLAAAVWSPTRMYAAGSLRTVFRYDATTAALTALANLVTYSSVTDLVALGVDDLLASDGSCVFRVTAAGEAPIGCAPVVLRDMKGGAGIPTFAVGNSGYIGNVTTTVLTTMNSSTTQQLNAVWVASNTFALAGGTNVLLRYNGTSWSGLTPPLTGPYTVSALWGSAANDAYVYLVDGGNIGRIYRWDGTTWTFVTIQPVLYNDVFTGSAASNGFNDSYLATYIGVVRVSGTLGAQQVVQNASPFAYDMYPLSISVAPGGGSALAVGANMTFNQGRSATSIMSSLSIADPRWFGMDAATLNAGGGLAGKLQRTKRAEIADRKAARHATLRRGAMR